MTEKSLDRASFASRLFAVKWFSCRTSQLMMMAASDNSNLNGCAAMGVREAERISSNLIIRLLLVSDPL